jgi:hypothetical protein
LTGFLRINRIVEGVVWLPLEPLLHPACDAGDGDEDDEELGALHEALLGAEAAGVEREWGWGMAAAAGSA